MNPQPGEIWLASRRHRIPPRPRPAAVSRLVCTSHYPAERSPYEVPLPRLPFLDRESVANVQGLGSLPTVRLERKIGRVSAGIMEQLKDALAFALDLERASK